MFSPSDYNDAVPQFSNGNYANEPLNPLYVEEPDSVNYKRGAEPLQTLPVQWWNWLWNKITAKLNNLNIYVKNIFNELAGLLSLVNVTPDATKEEVTTEQLKDMFATKYPQYLNDNFKSEALLQGRTRGVMVAPTDTWNDNTNTLSLTGGFGIINTYHKVTFSDCNLVIPNDNSVHFIVSDTSGVISIQNSIANNVILIGLCSNKQYCLLIDNNPDQCKDNIILKKWFGQNRITQNFVPALQSYYDTAIASIETNISIETVNNGYGINGGTYNNCTINIGTVSDGNNIHSSTLNNCTINIGTVLGSVGIHSSTLNNCTITIGTVSNGYGIYKSTLNNCTITIETVDSSSNSIHSSTLNNCTIKIGTLNDSYGINGGTYNNCTIKIGTVSGGGTSIFNCISDNCTITIKTVNSGYGIDGSTLNNCTIKIATVSGDASIVNSIVNCISDNCTINIGTVSGGHGIFSGTYNNCTIKIGTVSGGYGIYGGTYNNCTIKIGTVSGGGTCIHDNLLVNLNLTYIKISEITSLSNTYGKLNIVNDTVLHAS